MKRVLLVIAVLEFLGLLYIVNKMPRGEPIRRAYRPEIHEIAELRERNRIKQLAQCVLPEPPKGVAPVIAAGPKFDFAISVSPDWRRIAINTDTTFLQHPYATFGNKRGERIRISRIATGGTSRSFMADTLGHDLAADECEVSSGKAGSIWSFYPAKSQLKLLPGEIHFGLADAITSSGRRFKFSVSAPSAAERDSLASIVSQAVLRQ